MKGRDLIFGHLCFQNFNMFSSVSVVDTCLKTSSKGSSMHESAQRNVVLLDPGLI